MGKSEALTNQSQWQQIKLTDEEVINLVNLKFISSHYDYSVFTIMEMRDNGFSYREISKKVKEKNRGEEIE